MNSKFEIYPLIGVGDIKFGMTSDQVADLIGLSDDYDIDESNSERREYRRDNGFQAVYSARTKKLVEMGFSSNILELSFNDIYVFSKPEADVVKQLIIIDQNPYILFGFIVLNKLGLTLTGFHDGNKNQKAVTVFSEGRWDSMKTFFKPFSL